MYTKITFQFYFISIKIGWAPKILTGPLIKMFKGQAVPGGKQLS